MKKEDEFTKAFRELRQAVNKFNKIADSWPSLNLEEPHDKYFYERKETIKSNKPLNF